MLLGYCAGVEHLDLALRAGCDYLEMNFTAVADMDESEYQEVREKVKAHTLSVRAMNSFIPARYPLCTMEDFDAVLRYVDQGMQRAQALGTQVVVFGSGAARRVPEGMDRKEAWQRVAEFLTAAAPLAEKRGIRIAIEPLCHAECNCVNTVLQGKALADKVNHPSVKVLADLYHMGQNGEDMADIIQLGSQVIHAHIGRPGNRKYPMREDEYDYLPFFNALKTVGYEGGVSVEAAFIDGPEDIVMSIAYQKELVGR